jgi:putative membrane protein
MALLLSALRAVFPPLKVGVRLWAGVLTVGLYGLTVKAVLSAVQLPTADWGVGTTAIDGLVLGLLVAFRNSTAYDRWWEARKLWGQLVNDSRNLCLKVRDLAGPDDPDRREVAGLVVEFAEALKVHLRRGSVRARPGGPGLPPNQPLRIAGSLYDILGRWRRDGRLDGLSLLWIDSHAKALMDICGACERIRNTPISPSYRALVRHGIVIYLLIGPIYIIEDFGLLSLPVFMLASYFLIGIELVADEVEEPFGEGGDNLSLETYCATIARSVDEILGDSAEEEACLITSGRAQKAGEF